MVFVRVRETCVEKPEIEQLSTTLHWNDDNGIRTRVVNLLHNRDISSFFQKMGLLRPLFHLFSVFSNTQYIFYNKSMWKMSCPFSIWCWDSNPQPLEHESSPITTVPGTPLVDFLVAAFSCNGSIAKIIIKNIIILWKCWNISMDTDNRVATPKPF